MNQKGFILIQKNKINAKNREIHNLNKQNITAL